MKALIATPITTMAPITGMAIGIMLAMAAVASVATVDSALVRAPATVVAVCKLPPYNFYR